MSGLLQNARDGWVNWNTNGKFMALFLAALLFLWLTDRKDQKSKACTLWNYTAVMTVLCVFPVSAALLMGYQTPFYDYPWIWSAVPLTIIMAYGGTILWKKLSGDGTKVRMVVSCIMIVVLLFCSGNMGDSFRATEISEARQYAFDVLSQTEAYTVEQESICLWAPRNIMEWARSYDGNICMPYGRDMWDGALGAYSYDIYDEDTVKLYEWMENLAGQTEQKEQRTDFETDSYYIRIAREKGANCLLLPQKVDEDALKEITAYLGQEPKQVSEYYLFVL